MEECGKENNIWRFANCYFWFQRAPLELAPLIFPLLRLWLTTPHLLHVSDMKLRIFLSSGDKFTVGGREKESLPPELIFPSNILQEELLEVECALVGRLSNRLRWGYVRHTQTSLTPRAVICQHELWSRIFLIHFWGWGQCCLLYLFVLISEKQSNNLPKTAQKSYRIVFLDIFPCPSLISPSPGLGGACKIVFSDTGWIPSQAKGTNLAAVLW